LAGLVVAYDANLQDGHAYLGAISDPRFGVGTLEGVVLCLTYLFTMWPLRKIYLDAPEYNVPQFASAIERGIVVEEGRLAKHRFYNGKYWDQCLFAIYREKYLELISE
jgi:RimJ/RimL family protein N-acetyltransferase